MMLLTIGSCKIPISIFQLPNISQGLHIFLFTLSKKPTFRFLLKVHFNEKKVFRMLRTTCLCRAKIKP